MTRGIDKSVNVAHRQLCRMRKCCMSPTKVIVETHSGILCSLHSVCQCIKKLVFDSSSTFAISSQPDDTCQQNENVCWYFPALIRCQSNVIIMKWKSDRNKNIVHIHMTFVTCNQKFRCVSTTLKTGWMQWPRIQAGVIASASNQQHKHTHIQYHKAIGDTGKKCNPIRLCHGIFPPFLPTTNAWNTIGYVTKLYDTVYLCMAILFALFHFDW